MATSGKVSAVRRHGCSSRRPAGRRADRTLIQLRRAQVDAERKRGPRDPNFDGTARHYHSLLGRAGRQRCHADESGSRRCTVARRRVTNDEIDNTAPNIQPRSQ